MSSPCTGLTVTLRNGLKMPQIGLGTYRIRGQEIITRSVNAAVNLAGYKLIDTGAVYRSVQTIT